MKNENCRNVENCNSCNSCDSCEFCYYCHFCKNLKMTEHNLFCYSENFNGNKSFQQNRYRVFNREVSEERYKEIKNNILSILKNDNKLKLSEFWKSVTKEQWNQLLAIPEAKYFKKGFEYISGVKIDDIKGTCEGKIVEIDGREYVLKLKK